MSAPKLTAEYDGKFQVVYTTSAGVHSGFRAMPEAARLFAAAPELLEALKKVVAIADRDTVEFDEARAALAKAGVR